MNKDDLLKEMEFDCTSDADLVARAALNKVCLQLISYMRSLYEMDNTIFDMDKETYSFRNDVKVKLDQFLAGNINLNTLRNESNLNITSVTLTDFAHNRDFIKKIFECRDFMPIDDDAFTTETVDWAPSLVLTVSKQKDVYSDPETQDIYEKYLRLMNDKNMTSLIKPISEKYEAYLSTKKKTLCLYDHYYCVEITDGTKDTLTNTVRFEAGYDDLVLYREKLKNDLQDALENMEKLNTVHAHIFGMTKSEFRTNTKMN